MNDNTFNFNTKLSSPLANDSLAAQSIWFTTIDVNEADEPMLPPLLQEAFRQWELEASGIALFQTGEFSLYSKEGALIASAGTQAAAAADERNAAVQSALEGAAAAGTVFRSEAGPASATAVPIFRRTGSGLFGYFTYASVNGIDDSGTSAEACSLHFRSCFYRTFESIFVQDLMIQHKRSEQEAKRRDALFLSARRLYNGIDVASVLTEMLYSLEQLYPDAEIHLYLSQDHLHGDPRVKPLLFKSSEQDLVAKAFMECTPVSEKDRYGMTRIAVPMAGKQGAYGVLCMSIDGGKWDESNMPAFVMLADTAGTAFENAKLYEQSNLLINELRLINELTKRLNQSLKTREIFQFAGKELLRIFHADYCCLLQLNKAKDQFSVMSSNFPDIESEKFSPEYGFCGIVYRTKEPLIISDYWHTRVVTSKLMDDTGSRSLIAAPILVNGEVVGVILLTNKAPNFFSYENYKLLQVMCTHIGLAVTNASLLSEVRRMVITDNLTGLHARHYLNEQIQSRQRKDPSGSLILVDIDYFKRVNDTYGHLVGDQILVQVSRIIHSAIRNGDIAARWGGEEIAIYLPGIRTEQALRIAERIRERVEAETNPVVTVSCGVSEWTFDSEKISVESLFYRADMALYEAKNGGRNRIALG